MLLAAAPALAQSQAKTPDTILYGVAYYDEYMPVDRLETDVAMMKAANITVVRVAESTWGTLETAPGVFDFKHVDRVLNAMDKAGIKVIVGTPTYAVPTWLVREHPDVLAQTPRGPNQYGPRQNMDITNPEYRKASERVIVALVRHVKDHPAVIGYQVDNETKPYDTSGPNVQAAFQVWIRKRFPDLDTLNHAYGLNYWSNRINRWEDFPSVNASINASLSGAFAEFQRELVTDFLGWQAGLVRANARPGQFITHNFDLDWRGASYGVQSVVNHFDAAKALDIAGVDIYHPGQAQLTGTEIAFGGDLTRSLKHGKNYLVLETQAMGFPNWTPYPGQLRLQAFSHVASGANMVEYWHWGTTANAIETYWRGLLAQDYQPNPTYDEAKVIGAEFKRLGPKLVDMTKANKVAIYVSNRALTGVNAFRFGPNGQTGYNDVVRGLYDPLYRMNVEVDFLDPSTTDFSGYKLIIVPALYVASDAEIKRLNDFAKAGGHVLYTFKSGFSDENVKVRYDRQPGAIAEAAGVTYSQFTTPERMTLEGDPYKVGAEANAVRWWAELLTPTTAEVVARYDHPAWKNYAAITRNRHGKGEVTYMGFMPSEALAEKILAETVKRAGLWSEVNETGYPLVIRSGVLKSGKPVRYFLNYSDQAREVRYGFAPGRELIGGTGVKSGDTLRLDPWGVAIVEQGK
nr:beta-galactosidase [Asticcacaulis solisilvae]